MSNSENLVCKNKIYGYQNYGASDVRVIKRLGLQIVYSKIDSDYESMELCFYNDFSRGYMEFSLIKNFGAEQKGR